MSSLRIYLINDTTAERLDITDFSDLDNLEETLLIDSNSSTVTFSTSNTILIGGRNSEGYIYLKETFFSCDAENCLEKSISCEIEITCCNDRIRIYKIEAESLEWEVFNCTIKLSLIIDDALINVYDYLNDTYFWANETGWVQQLTENQVFRYQTDAEGNYQIGGNAIDQSLDAVTLSYNVIDIIKYHLNNLGVILDSTVANQLPYDRVTVAYDMYYLKDNTVAPPLWGNTLPEVTVLDLIDSYAKLTNSEYILSAENGQPKLTLKRKDLFNVPEKVIPLENFIYEDSISIGFAENQDGKCASKFYDYEKYGTFDYVIETQSIYQEFLDFNPSPSRTEKCKTVLPYHAPFINDDGTIKLNIDEIIILFGVTDSPFIVPISDDYPKGGLITVWSGGRDANNIAKIISELGENYNYPLHFNKDRIDGLYQNFFVIDNPDIGGNCELEVKDNFEMMPNPNEGYSFCDFLDDLDAFGVNLGFSFESDECTYIFKASEIKVNYDRGTFSLSKSIINS